MRGHVDAESLALYAEGQLSRRRAAQVRAHLSGCTECGTTMAALTEVSTQLSHVPAPPVPNLLAARLDAALSAEAAQRATAPTPAPAPAPAPRPPRRNPLFAPAALRILAAAGATLVVAGGVGYAVSQFSGSASSPSTSGTGRSAAAPATHRSGVQLAPNISPGGRIVKPKPNPGSPGKPVYARTSTDYQHGTLAAQARSQLAVYTVPGVSGPSRVAAANVPARVHNCVSQLAHGRPVLFVDLARYQQRPAIIVVLNDPGQAVVASYSCATLYSVRLPVTSAPTTR